MRDASSELPHGVRHLKERLISLPSVNSFVALFVLSVVARLLVWVVLTPHWIPASDADQYVLLARSIANGNGFALRFPQFELHPTAFRPPLFPALLSPFALLGGDALWPLRLATLLIGSLNAPLAYKLVAQFAHKRAALIGAITVALYPPLLANDTVVLSEGLGILLFQATVLLAIRAQPLAAGIMLGFLILARPNAYALVAIIVIYLAVTIGWRASVVTLLVAVAIVSPWAIRNKIQIGDFRLTTSEGFNLAAVYSEQAQENGRFTDPVFDDSFDQPKFRWAQFGESTWNSVLTKQGIDGLKANPTYVFENIGRNALAYSELTPSRSRWAEEVDGRHMGMRTYSLPLFYVVTIAGISGLWRNRSRKEVQLLALCAAQFAALSLVFIAAPRLRAPVDLILCFGFGITIDYLLNRYDVRKDPSP